MKTRWAAPLLLAAMWASALAVYPRLPERIPIHWNLQGEVDGWGGRAVWRDTHRVAGRAFVAAGLVMALAALAAVPFAHLASLAAVALALVVPVVYSYLAFRREAAAGVG